MADFRLPVAFQFEVKVKGKGVDADAAFQEVSGLGVEMEVETVVEGGQNMFAHKLPKPVKRPNLVLKRGLELEEGGLITWCEDVLEGDFAKKIETAEIDVSLLNEEGDAIASWNLSNCYPVKWDISGFDAMKNAIAIETIELAYTSMVRTL